MALFTFSHQTEALGLTRINVEGIELLFFSLWNFTILLQDDSSTFQIVKSVLF